jgi:5-hydroxyisourate hydrolase-like protein (transthyretin family)
MTFYIKQNDTSPAMLATLQNASGTAIDLTGASVRFHMRTVNGSASVVSAAATIVTAASGIVRYSWAAGDTATVGTYQAEFQVTYADATIETFPNDSYISVQIVDDIA